ncbi:unnamed protein product [Peronospora belbahrii]|uniref:Uncharacterized protein n=1 Tax=Peronospora belbahrii TaxID=622444 RepID=A0ABN8CYX8_9STRA|nr:unnamed protein product [Peronospora belbahrii]
MGHFSRREEVETTKLAVRTEAKSSRTVRFGNPEKGVENAREDHRIHHLMRLDSRLKRTAEALQGLSNGIADNFASEWRPILGTSQRSVPQAALAREFLNVATILDACRVTGLQNARLMSQSTRQKYLQR